MRSFRQQGQGIAVRLLIGACALLLAASIAQAAAPTAPTNLIVTAISPGQVNLTWTDRSTNESSFKIERKTGSAGTFAQIASVTSNVITFGDTGLTAGTTYFYRVRASNSSGNSSYTNQASVTTSAGDAIAPSAPTGLTTTAVSASQINLTWTAATDNVAVAGYRVEHCNPGFPGPVCGVQIGSTTGTAFSHTGLAEFSGHIYRVRAVDTAGNLGPYTTTVGTNTLDVTAPTAPSALTATAASASQINLSWTGSQDNSGGLKGYQIERCQGVSCTAFAWMAFVQNLSFIDIGLAAATYRYRVRVSDLSGNLGPYSSIVTATTSSTADTTPPSAPTGLTITAPVSNQLNLRWTASTDNIGVTGYLVERCQGTGCTTFAQIAALSTTATFSNTGLARATTYRYRVRATDVAGNPSAYSSGVTATTLNVADTTPPSAPTITPFTASPTQIDLSWTPAADNAVVTGYRVDRCGPQPIALVQCLDFTQIAAPTGTSFSSSGLSPRSVYTYRVRGVDAAGNLGAYGYSGWVWTLDANAPAAPAGLTATAVSPTRVNLAWTASTSADVTGYKIDRCQGTGCTNFFQVATSMGPSFSDTGLTAGTTYRYRVFATNAAGSGSAFSNIASATTPFTGGADTSTPTALAPNPLAISSGANGTLTAALSAAATVDSALNVTSSNTAAATVPASVSYTAGQTSVPIPVTGVAPGNAIITASANGGSASATINVTPAPPTVTSLTPVTLALTQGASGTLTVTLSAAQTADTQIALASSDSGVAFVDSSVTVPAGAVSALVPVAAVLPGAAQITALLNGASTSSQVTVTTAPASVVSLLPVVERIVAGGTTNLILSLSSAQPSDTVVALSISPPGIVTAPTQVTVPAGQTTTTVPVAGLALGQAGIIAMFNASSASAVVNVVPPPARMVAVEPLTHSMTVGATSRFTVRINAAQLANTEILLSVDNALLLQIPPSVTVAQGATSATFTATALATGSATITGSVNNTQSSAPLQLVQQAAAIVSLLPSPLPLQQGATGNLTVTINAAQAVDTTIPLTNNSPTVVQVPATVNVPAGATSTTVTVTALASGSAQLTASVNGTTAFSAIGVAAPIPVVTSISPGALTLSKGSPGVLRVTVSRAPNVPTAVTLGSNNPSFASVPPIVNIPAGALFAEFPVATNSVGPATISASLNGAAASTLVTVTPPELVTLTLLPAPASAFVGETVAFTATGTLADGTTEDFTTRVAWTSSNPNIATIASTGVASALAAGQTTIAASFSFTAAQTGLPVTITVLMTLTVNQAATLTLSAPTLALQAGQFTTVTVSSNSPAPSGGLVVSLTQSGPGSATFPPTVTIPANGTSVTFILTGAAAGQVTVVANATNRLAGFITFTIQPGVQINVVSPSSGTVGTVVTLTGTGFDPVPAINQITFRGANNTTVPAAAITASPTQITVAVPVSAISGPIIVANARGTAESLPFTVTAPPATTVSVSIASPAGGATVGEDSVSVNGTFVGPPNTGITANGVVAAIVGNQYFANVPLTAGANTIVVTATAPDGTQASVAVQVTSSGASPTRVTGTPLQGLAPLTVTFSITSDQPIQSVNGEFAVGSPFSVSPFSGTLSFTYQQPGAHTATFNVVRADGTTVTKTLRIVVQNVAEVDQLLQTVWNGFAQALVAQDKVAAMKSLTVSAQARYGRVFDVLLASLPTVAASVSAPAPALITGTVGEYFVTRQAPDGTQRLFLIYFIRDADGVWRLDTM